MRGVHQSPAGWRRASGDVEGKTYAQTPLGSPASQNAEHSSGSEAVTAWADVPVHMRVQRTGRLWDVRLNLGRIGLGYPCRQIATMPARDVARICDNAIRRVLDTTPGGYMVLDSEIMRYANIVQGDEYQRWLQVLADQTQRNCAAAVAEGVVPSVAAPTEKLYPQALPTYDAPTQTVSQYAQPSYEQVQTYSDVALAKGDTKGSGLIVAGREIPTWALVGGAVVGAAVIGYYTTRPRRGASARRNPSRKRKAKRGARKSKGRRA